MTEKKEQDKDLNLALWLRVCETDPAFTKQVKQRGGFTAINAQYQLQKATKEWGPYGNRWAMRELEWGEVRDGKGNLLEITLDACFDFPDHSDGGNGCRFPISACMPYKPGNDTRKKLLTDATTKALSKLGFDALIFMGIGDAKADYTDNKYVQGSEPSAADIHENPVKHQAPATSVAPPEDWETRKVGFGKFKDRTWGEMAQASIGGERCGWLEWYVSTDPEEGDPKYHQSNKKRQAAAMKCLDRIRASEAEQGEYLSPDDDFPPSDGEVPF